MMHINLYIINVKNSTGEHWVLSLRFPKFWGAANLLLVQCYTIMLSAAAIIVMNYNGMYYSVG